jgi:putative Mg2+ transporter-C (MgtC) family protein
MTNDLSWQTIALRLALTLFAGAVIGVNRGERNRPAGLRTTMLVCLAASLSMIEVNVLLPTVGKAHDSYVVLDLMRLPLGILSGMGFIGAGAILRKGEFVTGVTTAATMWFVTMLGICIGGGQLVLGMGALAASVLILWGLKWVEECWLKTHQGTLKIISRAGGLPRAELEKTLHRDGYHFKSWITYSAENHNKREELTCEMRWHASKGKALPPFLAELSDRPDVEMLEWKFEDQ